MGEQHGGVFEGDGGKCMSDGLVSVNIPTYNSEKTLEKTLKSISDQNYPDIELIIIDSNSKDNTIHIAEKYNTKILKYDGKLLGARFVGLKESKGDYVLLLDSDQILERTAIKRSVDLIQNYDMLILEEFTYNPTNWLQRLFDADRRFIHRLYKIHLDSLDGVLLARFYRKKILESAFESIPKELMPIVVAHDHAFIYYEAYKVSQKVGMLPDALWHIEPTTLMELWKKNYRYGQTTNDLVKKGYYQELLNKKVRFRKGALDLKNFKYGMQSYFLLMLKGVAYQIGYWKGEK